MVYSNSVETRPLEISNLPKEVHDDLAWGIEFFDPKYINEATQIPHQTEITVISPSYFSYFDELFGISKRVSFASFTDPKGYHSQAKRFFRHHLIPNIDLEKTLESFIKKINSFLEKKDFLHIGEERVKEMITAFLQNAIELQELLRWIQSSIYRYKKG